jgi:hypothetical protein
MLQEAIDRNRRRWARYRRAARVRDAILATLPDGSDGPVAWDAIERRMRVVMRCNATLAPLRAARERRRARLGI